MYAIAYHSGPLYAIVCIAFTTKVINAFPTPQFPYV